MMCGIIMIHHTYNLIIAKGKIINIQLNFVLSCFRVTPCADSDTVQICSNLLLSSLLKYNSDDDVY